MNNFLSSNFCCNEAKSFLWITKANLIGGNYSVLILLTTFMRTVHQDTMIKILNLLPAVVALN